MWKKRVLVTQWAGQAWDELCHTFDFAAAARKIGMLMTIDGTNDDLIRIDGVEKYTFTDADAGNLPANEASYDDDDEEEEEGEKEDEEEYEETEKVQLSPLASFKPNQNERVGMQTSDEASS